MFISNFWSGNVSNRYITEHFRFLDIARPCDDVRTHMGFWIRDLLLQRRAILNIPPSIKMCSWGKL